MAAELANLERQIAELRDCKPLTEAEVQALCDKVSAAQPRPNHPLRGSCLAHASALASAARV